MKDDDLLDLVIQKFRWLRLPGIAARLKDVVEHARTESYLSPRPVLTA
jgi:hypothetical protein